MENINWICKSTTVNNNIVWMCKPSVKEHFEATSNTVQLFSATNYGGNSSSFGIGRYTSTQLDKIGPKALQSIKVPSGLVALIYQNADFTGYGKAISTDTPDLSKVTDSKNTGFNWSNQMQSLIVQPHVALPTSISDKMPKISLVAPDPNSFITAVSGAVLTRIDDKSYLYVDPNNKDNIYWYSAGDLQIIPPFSMANITDLQLWFDGRDPAGNGNQPADGSNITVWNDKSGKGNNTNAITGTPTYSVKNGVVFDGNSYFTLPNGSIPFGDSSYSIYVIAMTGYDTQNRYGSIIGGGVAGSNQNLRIMTTMNPGAAIYTSWWGNDIAKGTTTKNVPFLYNTFYDSGSTQTIYFNGAQVHTGKPSPRNQPNGPNYIGFNAANEKMLGTISEILVFNSSHTDPQRQIIEGYLAWKWGLQSNLPDNHPFKSAAPSGSSAFPKVPKFFKADIPKANWLGCISMSPNGKNIVAQGVDLGCALSKDSGKTWSIISKKDYNYASPICISNQGQILMTTAGSGIYFSSDYGANWKEIADKWQYPRQPACSKDGTIWYFADQGRGLWKSTDSGNSFNPIKTAVPGSGGNNCIACTDDGNTLYITSYGGYMYKSTDGANSWNIMNQDKNPRGSNGTWQRIYCSADGKIITAGNADPGQLWLSTDSGASWNDITPSGYRFYNGWSQALSRDGSTIIIGCDQPNWILLMSKDLGKTWTTMKKTGLERNDGYADYNTLYLSEDASVVAVTLATPGVLAIIN